MMDRLAFIGTVAGGLLAIPLAADAQQAAKVPRQGLLGHDQGARGGSDCAAKQHALQ
jgi:hypothetical protein